MRYDSSLKRCALAAQSSVVFCGGNWLAAGHCVVAQVGAVHLSTSPVHAESDWAAQGGDVVGDRIRA
jgi:hypothetical protein